MPSGGGGAPPALGRLLPDHGQLPPEFGEPIHGDAEEAETLEDVDPDADVVITSITAAATGAGEAASSSYSAVEVDITPSFPPEPPALGGARHATGEVAAPETGGLVQGAGSPNPQGATPLATSHGGG